MKIKFFLYCVFLICWLSKGIHAAPMAVYAPEQEWYVVSTDYFQCTIFIGCMYPVWFQSADGKIEYPRSFMLDWIKKSDAPDTEIHYLHRDFFAEINLIENGEDCLVFECVGKFCLNRKRFPDVTARYRYTMRRNSPEILLEGELTVDPDGKRQLCLVNLGVLAWEQTPFEEFRIVGEEARDFRLPEKPPQTFKSRTGLSLITNSGLEVGIRGPAVAWNNSDKRYFTYIAGEKSQEERLWDGKQPLNFKIKLYFDGRKRP